MKKQETHNEKYAQLQNQYYQFKNKDDKKANQILGQMYFVCKELQRNYILKYCRKNGVYFSEDDLEDKIQEATLYVINKYLYKDNFYIQRLSAYAYFGTLKVLFKDKDREMLEESLDEIIETGRESEIANKKIMF